MSINYTNKVNERLIGASVTNESHTIGTIGVAISSPGLIRLIEVPQAPSPLSTVSIPGYNEIFVGSPVAMQFLVDYVTGVITFNVAQNGNAILVSYIGLGSEFAAEDVNELQGPVGVALNYNGSLSNNIVKPVNISNTVTDDFIFPRDITADRNLIAITQTTTDLLKSRTGNLLLEPLSNSITAIKLANATGTVILNIDTTNSRVGINNSAPSVELDVTGAITSSTDITTSTKVNTNEVKGKTGNLLLEPFADSTTAIKLANVSGIAIVDVDTTNSRVGINNNSPSTELDVIGAITQSETYSATGHSHQGVAGDETLDAGVGSSTPTNPKFVAAAMFNVHDNGFPLTGTANYLAGVIGADSITGAQATSYPKGAVLAQISDGVTASDGAVVAYVDGDSSVTLANAAFKAMQNNSQSGSGFTYGLDLFGAAHDGYLELSIKNAAIRMDHEVCIFNSSGTPTNGVTGAGFAQIGSLYINNSTGDLYSNTGTKAVPVWTIFDTGTSGANVHLSNLSAVAINTTLLPGVDASIDLGSTTKRWENLWLSGVALIGGVSIDASAILELDSTTQGFLPPRMTTTQQNAISSPAAGLIIFNTSTNQFSGYNGTSWVILG